MKNAPPGPLQPSGAMWSGSATRTKARLTPGNISVQEGKHQAPCKQQQVKIAREGITRSCLVGHQGTAPFHFRSKDSNCAGASHTAKPGLGWRYPLWAQR